MKDQFQRNIDYLRVSVTDRCNLRCKYCMPNGVCPVTHEEVLRYDEVLRLVRLFARLGITHVRVTGGEPLVRKDVVELVAGLKQTEGIRTVSMTTNGTLLPKFGEELQKAGLDSVNISLDTTDEDLAAAITGQSGVVALVEESVALMQRLNIPVKLNAVLLKETEASMANVARFAERGVPVRFIELMPIGSGAGMAGLSSAEALLALRRAYPDLHPAKEHLGFGPARYFESARLKAPIGLIDAVSHRFCASCNRVRLTSTGVLKPCLCFDEGRALAPLLRGGADDEALLFAMRACIYKKPLQHCFDAPEGVTEHKLMSQIGG